jgi:hypothetical protein
LGLVLSLLRIDKPTSEILLKERVQAISGNNQVIRLIAKATDVVSDNKTNFQEARILSEIRPIFTDSEHKPKAAVIVHNFKVVHYEDFQSKEFFFTLETKDLAYLQKVITRAIQKADQLQAMLVDANITYLQSESNH